MKTFLKKIVLSCLIFILLAFSFVRTAYAQTDTGAWYNQSYEEWSRKVFTGNEQEIFGERYTFAQVQWVVYSLASLIAGTNLLECAGLAAEDTIDQFKSCIDNFGPVSGNNSSSGSPMVGLALISDTLMSAHVASGVEYVSNLASKFHLIPPAYAQTQGFGFRSLQPVQKIWAAFRNMSYLLAILAILALSFMIMFRVKISPQTVITVQSALPKLAITLVLITFSYAIAGFLIDLSYVVLAIVASLVKSQGLAGNLTPPLDFLQLAQKMWGSASWPITSIIILVSLPIIILVIGGGLLLGAAGGSFALPVIGTVGGAGMGALFGVVILLIIGVFILYTLVRILWTMLKSFINIVLLTIFGPLIILLGAVSPSFGGFGMWLRNLVANIAVFPTIAIMAFLAHLLFWSSDNVLNQIFRESGFLNPYQIANNLSGGFSLPLFSPGSFLVSLLAGLGILFIIPSAAQLIKSMVEGKPFAYGTAIGEAFAPAGWMGNLAPVRAAREQMTLVGLSRFLSGLSGRYKGPGHQTLQELTTATEKKSGRS